MDVVSIGESMVAFNPNGIGRLRAIESFHKFTGGAETNTLIGLSRLGFSTRWISLLGNDEFGHFVQSSVRAEGVDVSFVKMLSDSQTGVFFIERSIMEDCKSLYYRYNSAIRNLSEEYIEESMIEDSKILYLTGITPAINSSCLNAVIKAISIAKSKGRKVVFDPNVRLKLLDIVRSREVLIPIMKTCDIVLPNDTEMSILFPDKTHEAVANELISNGVQILVVKKGKEGAAAYTVEGSYKVKAYLLDSIASTMGAGDAFNAGFIAGVLNRDDIVNCLRKGAAMGTFATMGYDSYQSLPSEEELENFMSGRQYGVVR